MSPPAALPERTATTLAGIRNNKLPIHPGLEMTKFVPWNGDKPDGATAWDRVCQAARHAAPLAERWLQRRRAWLERRGDSAVVFEVETRSPCVLWLAAPTPLELGFCVHHTYGVPYLPGSALKGLARAHALALHQGTPDEPDAETRRLFGCHEGAEAHAGRVTFLDGIPLSAPDGQWLERDVMTPHHGEYYQGTSKWPHDCEDPVPVGFARIPVGVRFEVALVAGPGGGPADVAAARDLVLAALAARGLGAKTNSGYGVFGLPRPTEARSGGGGPRGPRERPHAPQGEPTTFRGVVVRFDKAHVWFQNPAGEERSVPREHLERRFNFSPGGWNPLRKQEPKVEFLLEFRGTDLVSVRKVSS